MGQQKEGANAGASNLTEVWIGVGFLAIVVVGVVTVFGAQLEGVFSSEPPAAMSQTQPSSNTASPTSTRDAKKQQAPSTKAPAK